MNNKILVIINIVFNIKLCDDFPVCTATPKLVLTLIVWLTL